MQSFVLSAKNIQLLNADLKNVKKRALDLKNYVAD